MKATGNGSQNKGQYNTRTKHKLSYVSAKMYHIGTSNIEKVQGDQDHFFTKEMLISPSILKLHKNP